MWIYIYKKKKNNKRLTLPFHHPSRLFRACPLRGESFSYPPFRSPYAAAQIGLHPSRRGCLRKPLAVLWIEVQGDGFIRRLQGYYCPNKHVLCQTWSTAAAQRPLNFIWISISPSFLRFLPHCFQTWIAYCTGLLHFFHLNGLHQALAPDFLPTTLVPTSSGFWSFSTFWVFAFFPVAGGQDAPQPLLSRSSMSLLTRAGPSEHSKPPRWYTSLHVHYRLTNCLNRTRSGWAKLSKKAVKSLSFSTFYTHAALTNRPPSHKAQQEKMFLQHCYNINQKTWAETFSPKDHFWNCRRTAGTSISS